LQSVGTAALIRNHGARWEWSASRPGRGKSRDAHRNGGCVGHTASLDALKNSNISFPAANRATIARLPSP